MFARRPPAIESRQEIRSSMDRRALSRPATRGPETPQASVTGFLLAREAIALLPWADKPES
jgi:hypothetical protein